MQRWMVMGMADELEFVCERCVHYEVCDRSSRMIWARLSKEKVCSDFMEVVRCKDCKHRIYSEFDGCHVCHHGGFNAINEEHFCSYGERERQ